jgi:hypothetical protein
VTSKLCSAWQERKPLLLLISLHTRCEHTCSQLSSCLSDSVRHSPLTRPKLLTFDHIFPPPFQSLKSPPRTAILYASLSSPNFRELHTYLLSLASKPTPTVEYILRYISLDRDKDTRSYLSGYGVALDLKKMDYLAIDDRHSRFKGAVLSLLLSNPLNYTS